MKFFCAGFAICLLPAMQAGALLSISGDPNNGYVPDQLGTVDPVGQTVTGFVTLGDGSLGFNGGLTTGPGGVLYGIANDSSGLGTLMTIQSDGTVAVIGASEGLGSGFLGGLAWDPVANTFLGVAMDTSGNAFLYNISTSGIVSPGLDVGMNFSGLAYDPGIDTFFGIGNDSSGNSTLYSFTLSTSEVNLGVLGTGFGGLTYDPTNDVLWAIAPVNNAGSQLFQISTAGVLSSPIFTLGDGFVELATASSTTSPGSSAPEPSTCIGVFSGLASLMGASKFRKRKI